MTYNVFGGTLNPTLLYIMLIILFACAVCGYVNRLVPRLDFSARDCAKQISLLLYLCGFDSIC